MTWWEWIRILSLVVNLSGAVGYAILIYRHRRKHKLDDNEFNEYLSLRNRDALRSIAKDLHGHEYGQLTTNQHKNGKT